MDGTNGVSPKENLTAKGVWKSVTASGSTHVYYGLRIRHCQNNNSILILFLFELRPKVSYQKKQNMHPKISLLLFSLLGVASSAPTVEVAGRSPVAELEERTVGGVSFSFIAFYPPFPSVDSKECVLTPLETGLSIHQCQLRGYM